MRELAIAIVVGVFFAGGVTAHAATLGPAQVSAVGSDDAGTVACAIDGVTLRYETGYDTVQGSFGAQAVVVDGLAGCVGETISVTVRGAGGVPVGQGSTVVTAAVQPVPLGATVSAEAVHGVAVVISS